ncbi:hypothetical protein A4S06_05285 [Erysipelotrichaceae bacterium MTC7]|nr:hypothetical protein A4S06_05285 [Erysipelotrichaceae bacterium MTC7]
MKNFIKVEIEEVDFKEIETTYKLINSSCVVELDEDSKTIIVLYGSDVAVYGLTTESFDKVWKTLLGEC